MLLNEILASPIDSLYEDYGNLKFINKKFAPALKRMALKRRKVDAEHGYGMINHYTSIATLGANSEILSMPFKSNAASINALAEPDVLGLVVSVDEEQVLIVMKDFEKNEKLYTLGIDMGALSDMINSSDTESTLMKDVALLFGFTERGERRKFSRRSAPSTRIAAELADLEIKRAVAAPTISTLTGLILKACKANSLVATLNIIKKDIQRAETIKRREENRSGMYSKDPAWIEKFNASAKRSLKDRLDVFKSSKAFGVDKIEDLVDAALNKGYLDKIKIGGFVYDLTGSDIRLDVLMSTSKNNMYDESYVKYSINTETREYAEFLQQRRAVYHIQDADEQEKQMAEFWKQSPPPTVKIMLKLDKGTIIPASVQISK